MNLSSLQKLLRGSLKNPGTITSVLELRGDASTRQYFRVTFKGGDETSDTPQTMIMMKYPPSHVVSGELAFLNVHRYLKAAGISVPLVYLHIPEEHILFLEDGGDITLEDIVEETGFSEKVGNIYEESIDQLVTIQTEASRHLDERALPSTYSFDFEKLMWEMDFFAIWGLEKLKLIPDKKRVVKEFISHVEPVINDLIKLPLVLTHRDYHSRNIMVLPDGSIRIIDFQDARMGNIYYDLSSLLFDSYVVMPTRERERFFNRYAELVKGEPFASWKSKEENWHNLYTMAIQRNLKALGTFFYMFYGTGNDRYLRYIEPTITYLMENPVLSEKYEHLSDHIVPLLTELAGQVNLERGGSIEGHDPRSRSGDKAPSSDV